jgi:hypothetical protein
MTMHDGAGLIHANLTYNNIKLERRYLGTFATHSIAVFLVNKAECPTGLQWAEAGIGHTR